RVNTDGSIDTNWNPNGGPNNSVGALALQPDGQLLVGGKFTAFNGVPRNGLVRLKGDAVPPQLGQPTRLPNGQVQFFLYCDGQSHYSIEASSNLVSWISIADFIATTNPVLIVDSAASSFQKRFYRALKLP